MVWTRVALYGILTSCMQWCPSIRVGVVVRLPYMDVHIHGSDVPIEGSHVPIEGSLIIYSILCTYTWLFMHAVA